MPKGVEFAFQSNTAFGGVILVTSPAFTPQMRGAINGLLSGAERAIATAGENEKQGKALYEAQKTKR